MPTCINKIILILAEIINVVFIFIHFINLINMKLKRVKKYLNRVMILFIY